MGQLLREERVSRGSECCDRRLWGICGGGGVVCWGPPPTCFHFLQNSITIFHAFILYISFAIFNINQWIIEDHSIIHLESTFTFGMQASFSITPSLEMLWASHTTCSLSALEAGRGSWRAPQSWWMGAQCPGLGMAIDSWSKGGLQLLDSNLAVCSGSHGNVQNLITKA